MDENDIPTSEYEETSGDDEKRITYAVHPHTLPDGMRVDPQGRTLSLADLEENYDIPASDAKYILADVPALQKHNTNSYKTVCRDLRCGKQATVYGSLYSGVDRHGFCCSCANKWTNDPSGQVSSYFCLMTHSISSYSPNACIILSEENQTLKTR